jgi:hypothetical protein
MKSSVFVLVLVALLVVSVAPAFAAGNDSTCQVGVCQYGYVQSLNPKTHVISTRCRTWAEWQAMQVKEGIGNAIQGAQGTYERKVTQPVTKAGTQLAAPAVGNRQTQNGACLLSGRTNCYGGR